MKRSCRRGYKLKNGKCQKIKNYFFNSSQRKRKRFWILLGGISGILLGSWMIFYLKNNWGFFPAAIGVLSLIWMR